ncbi:MAG: hypothetical protein AABY93_14530 [Bacteroidota bacterium]
MPSLIPGFEYDIFISYRHNDNRSGWVTEFVKALQEELAATLKDSISVYFDTNPHDGLLETHDVDDSLKEKLKCLIFIPIISQTYCDTKSFAWNHEFLAFKNTAFQDQFGLKIKLPNGNVASRVLPIRIHEIDAGDQKMLEDELQTKLRAIDFIYHSAGVNRPLTAKDERELNLNKTFYRDQINKVANSVKEIIVGLQNAQALSAHPAAEKQQTAPNRIPFRTELNRRNVLRASLAYVLFSVVLWKLTSISIDLFDFPAGSLKFVTLALIVFFPISILMAWLFERSPQGFIRTGSSASQLNPFSPDQKKPLTSNAFILLMLATVIALFSFFPPNTNNKEAGSANSSGIDPSLAVVPFDNLSKDPSQDYISDGMMEAILSHLNKIEGLRLTSRTTMMTYKGSQKTIQEIADEVGVRFVLEGSVQRVDNTIRINAQLIDGKTDKHIWSEYYDRNLSDLLSIQSEVAQQIADKLEVKVKPTTKANIDALPTKNAEAYDLYLKASHLSFRFDSLEQYRFLLEKAIELDPQFASAYAAMGWYWIFQGFFGSTTRISSREIVQKAEPLLNKAISLNPNEAPAHINLGLLNLWYKWDFYAADRENNYAAQLEPSNLDAMDADFQVSMGRFKEAVKLAKLRMKAEPNNVQRKVNMGFTLYFNGQNEESMLFLDSAWGTKAKPSAPTYYAELGRAYLYHGKYEWVVAVIEEGFKKGFTGPRLKGTLVIALIHLSKPERAKELLNAIKKQSTESSVGSPSFYAAMIYAQLGEVDLAFQWLEKAYADHEVEMYWLKVEPPFEPLHKDPRWKIMLDKVGFPVE